MPTQPEEVGARLRAVRQIRYRRLDDAAYEYRSKHPGADSAKTYAKWELTGDMGVPELLLVCEMLRCDPCWVLTGIGTPVSDQADAVKVMGKLETILKKLEGESLHRLRARLEAAEDGAQDPPTDATGSSRGG